MPKESRTRSDSRASPYLLNSSSYRRHPSSSSSTSWSRPKSSLAAAKEWEEVHCPVCIEHLHNVVLLLCSSHERGCRSFMCDTSYHHSNCLDQYCKCFTTSSSALDNSGKQPSGFSCPLCSGAVTGWTVKDAARDFMNAKARCCSLESCGFSGSYGEPRKNARNDHPSVQPSEADPERQLDWRRMELRETLGIFSARCSLLWVEGEDGGEAFDEDGDLGGVFQILQRFMFFLVWRVSGLPGGMTRYPLRFTRSSVKEFI